MMATSDVSRKVLRFKLQLSESAESETVLKILQKLKGLDITLDILAETGIGKTVNSLRKHKLAGEFAKSLVKYWKELVPKEAASKTTDLNTSLEVHFQGELNDPNCPRNGSLARDKSKPGRQEDRQAAASEKELQEETEQRNLKENLLNQQKTNILEKEDLNRKLEKKEGGTDDSVASKRKRRRDRNLDNDDIIFGSNNSEDHHREFKPVSREKSKDNFDTGKKFRAERESKKEPRASPKSKWPVEDSRTTDSRDKANDDDTSEMPRSSKGHIETKRCPSERKRVRFKDERKPIDKGKPKDTKKTKIKHEDKPSEKDLEVSFESCLSYDLKAPKRKKRSGASKNLPKKPPKKPQTAEQGEPAKVPSMNSVKSPIVSEHDVPDKKGSVADLLHIPLPAHLPDWDVPYSVKDFESKVESVSSPCEIPEEPSAFTGQRLNKKMQVYSGAKTTFLPAMMSLYRQCIRTLQNNIDLLYEIGGVPFEIIEPVLERCTPEQLLRIEEFNPVYVGATDDLWGRHCQRQFRGAELQEYESWKEMYVRLSEERERKFRRLSKSIVSAQSRKPKGRQVKLVTTDTKPSRNARIPHKIHGASGPLHHGASGSLHHGASGPLHHGASGPLHHGSSGPLHHGATSPLQQPHLPDRPSVKRQETDLRPSYQEPPKPGPSTSNPRTNNIQDARKKTRVAPMMAKSLKAFKKMGRR